MFESVDEVSNYENDISILRMPAGTTRAQQSQVVLVAQWSSCSWTLLEVQAQDNVADDYNE